MVAVLPVLDTSVVYEPVPDFTSILYPVIGELPGLGAVQDRLICVGDTGTAESPVGDPGADGADDAVGWPTASPDGF